MEGESQEGAEAVLALMEYAEETTAFKEGGKSREVGAQP